MSENSPRICLVCKNDHNNKDRPWCDRSDLEIAYDLQLIETLKLTIKKLKHIYEYTPTFKYDVCFTRKQIEQILSGASECK